MPRKAAPAVDPLARLRRVRAALAASRPIAPDDALALVAAIDGAMAGARTIEVGMGLGPGWQRELRRARRDEAFEYLFGAFFPNGSARSRANAAVSELNRYRSTGYPADRRRGVAPDGRRGAMFAFLEAADGAVPSRDYLRKLIEP